jgi:hypothetical protein
MNETQTVTLLAPPTETSSWQNALHCVSSIAENVTAPRVDGAVDAEVEEACKQVGEGTINMTSEHGDDPSSSADLHCEESLPLHCATHGTNGNDEERQKTALATPTVCCCSLAEAGLPDSDDRVNTRRKIAVLRIVVGVVHSCKL